MNGLSAREIEQVKLTATWLNTIGAGVVVIGTVTPLALFVRTIEQYGLTQIQKGDLWVMVGTLFWLPMGYLVHRWAKRFLRRLGP